MATITELLKAMNTKEAAVSAADLASELEASKEGTLKQLTREKDKGNVKGSSQEGWLITDAGRKALEEGDIHPSMIEEGVTQRQQFEAIGQRIGITESKIVVATDIVWSGDFEDVNWVWDALGQADIRKDLRSVWVNSWRAKLHKGIPPDLEVELTGVSKAAAEVEKGAAPSKPAGRDYIILEDEPVRVGENLGDYSLQDAKDILAIRAVRNRFSGVGQAGAGQGAGAGVGNTGEKVSDLLTALSPYLNKGSDTELLRELLGDKLEIQRRDILAHIPQQGEPAHPKSFIEQITEVVTAFSSLREAGPVIRGILGIPESPGGNLSAGVPVQVKGPDGQAVVMDLGQVIDWRKFQNEERRADERHDSLMGLAKTVRENLPDGVAALKAAASEAGGSTGTKKTGTESESQPQVFSCGDCGKQFSAPPGWAGQSIKCPNPECGHEYSKEELLA